MPFDGKDFPLIKVPFCFATATPDERLLELARLLENEQEWRNKIMVWDFRDIARSVSADLYGDPEEASHCGTAGCAVGLAGCVWPEMIFPNLFHDPTYGAWLGVEAYFAMNDEEASRIFGSNEEYGLIAMKDVRPDQVAAAIRKFVAKRQAS